MDTMHQAGSQSKNSLHEQGKKFARDMMALGYQLVPLRGKDAYDPGWATNAYPIFDLEERIERGNNIGIIFGHLLPDGTRLIGLDVDFGDRELSALIWSQLPRGTFRIGNPFKFLMPLRVRDEEAGSRDHSFYNGPVLGAERQAIQVLGRGQKAPAGPKQAAGWGVHPTAKTPYQWYPDAAGKRIWELRPEDAPYVADLAGLIDAIAAVLEPKGWTRKAPRNPDAGGTGEAFTGPFSKAMLDDATALLEAEIKTLEGMAAGAGRGTRAFELGLQVGAVIKAAHIDLDQTLERLRAAMPDNDNALREFQRGVEASEGQRQRTIHERENPDWAAAAKAQGINWEEVIKGAAAGAEDFKSEEKAGARETYKRPLTAGACDILQKGIRERDPEKSRKLKDMARGFMTSLLAAGMATHADLMEQWDRNIQTLHDPVHTRQAQAEKEELPRLQPTEPGWALCAARLMAAGRDAGEAVRAAQTLHKTPDDGDPLGPEEEEILRKIGAVSWSTDAQGNADSKAWSDFAFFLAGQLNVWPFYDEFLQRIVFRRLMKRAARLETASDADLARWSSGMDAAVAGLCAMATDRTKAWGAVNYTPSARDVEMWLGDMARTHSFNSVIETLNQWQAWDGVERLKDWMARYTGHTPQDGDYEYVCRVGEHWMVNWVARLQRPGHKHDEVPVLVGFQGERKTDLPSALADVITPDGATSIPNIDFNSSNNINHMAGATAGKVLVEYAELEHLSGAKQAHIKSRISARVDSGRNPYGRDSYDRKRQFGLIGTANASVPGHDAADITEEIAQMPVWLRDGRKRELMAEANTGFLIDPSGARRWHGVTVLVYKIHLEALTAEAPQLIAEARVRVEQLGYGRLYMSPETEALVSRQVSRFYVTSGLKEEVLGALASVTQPSFRISAYNLRKLLRLSSHEKTRDLSAAMRQLEFASYKSNGMIVYYRGVLDECGEPLQVIEASGTAKLVPQAGSAAGSSFAPG